jgi:ankyrin repeat protein
LADAVKTAWTHCRRTLPLLIVAGVLVGCESPPERAQRELKKRGVAPSGEALLTATRNGDASVVQWLLQTGVSPEIRDAEGRTPVRIAIQRHDPALALRLMEAGGRAETVATDGSSALGAALSTGDPWLAERLVAAGARSQGNMPSGDSLLVWAIRDGRTSWAKRALADGSDPRQRTRDGDTLLCLAMRSGHREIIGDLLAKGADAASPGSDGRTPVHHVLDRDWLEFLPAVIKAGGDPNAVDPRHHESPLEVAVHRKDAGLLRLLLSLGADPDRRNAAGETVAHGVLRQPWPEARRLLIDARANFNLPDASGILPLEQAVTARDFALAEELAQAGANARPEVWRVALWQALSQRDAEAARIWLKLGADPAAADAKGRLPLEWATLLGDVPLCQVLLNANAPAGDALYLACRDGDRGLTGMLLAAGVSPNRPRAPWLDTPLNAAIRSGRDDLACLLLDKGAHPFLRGEEGQTPMNLAIARRRPMALEQLLARGADPNIPCLTPARPEFLKHVRTKTMRWVLKNDRNVTPLMVAASTGDTRIAMLLLAAGAKIDVTTRNIRYWPINFASSEQDVPMMRVLLGQDPKHEERQIVISLSEQRVRVYGFRGDEILATRVSTGRTGFATPPGEYVITSKHRDWKSTLYHAEMPYFQRLSCGDFGLHEGVVPGYPASHGCIRVPSGSAAKLYALTKIGDRVRIEP